VHFVGRVAQVFEVQSANQEIGALAVAIVTHKRASSVWEEEKKGMMEVGKKGAPWVYPWSIQQMVPVESVWHTLTHRVR
jgi:hypothetical protein